MKTCEEHCWQIAHERRRSYRTALNASKWRCCTLMDGIAEPKLFAWKIKIKIEIFNVVLRDRLFINIQEVPKKMYTHNT
jgi:hypothetical protein